MKRINNIKTIVVSAVLLLLTGTTAQAQSDRDWSTPYNYSSTMGYLSLYDHPSVAEQSSIFSLYEPSEVGLKGSLLAFIDRDWDSQNDYNGTVYGDEEQALKIPAGNGLGILIAMGLGYAILVFLSRKRIKVQ